MTIKKTNGQVAPMEWTLSLPSQQELEQEMSQAFRAAREGLRVLTEAEQRVMNEANKQKLVMEVHAQKAQVALQGSQQTRMLNGRSTYETAVHHNELLQASAGTACEGVMRQVVKYDLEAMTRQNQKLMELYFINLVTEMTREVYQKDKPEVVVKEVVKEVIKEVPKKGFWGF